jgi:SAM-dependent methyltransferase
MVARLRAKSDLQNVSIVQGFSDSSTDREQFESAEFDAIVSRQLGNALFDPLAAFKNWYDWLRPHGTVILIDGFYTKSSWGGDWESHSDILPLSACQSLSTLPYLLEISGFDVETAREMRAVNQRPSTRTKRFVVVARRPQ